jgi:hypothetical protein
MTAIAIRKKLTSYLQVADEKKVKAIYALVKDDLEQDEWEYSIGLKKQLDVGYAYYKSGGKMISSAEAGKEISKLLPAKKRK